MNTIKVSNGTVKMVAHRGLSGLERENTNAAFIAAGNRSYFGIETDIHRTTDGKFAVIHDDTPLRVSGDDVVVEDCSSAQLAQILLYDKQGTKLRQDLKIPLLEEYIAICQSYDKIAVLEFKTDFAAPEIDAIVAIIQGMGYLESTIFISFHLSALIKLRQQYPQAKAQYLIDHFPDDLPDTLLRYQLDLDIHYKAIDEAKIKMLHAKGLTVNCWTVDDPDTARQLIDWGVDYLTTNILE